MNRIIDSNGRPAIPQIDGTQLACAMLLNGRGAELEPTEQAVDILDRIDALNREIMRRAQGNQNNG